MSTINLRIDDNDKKEFALLCESLGLSVSTALNMFIKQSVREQSLALYLSLEIPNSVTVKAMEDACNGTGLSPAYETVEDLMQALNT